MEGRDLERKLTLEGVVMMVTCCPWDAKRVAMSQRGIIWPGARYGMK